MIKFRMLAILIIATFSSSMVSSQPFNETFGHEGNKANTFLEELKRAFKADDIDKIGALSNSKLTLMFWEEGRRVGIDGRLVSVEIGDRNELYNNRNLILSKRMKDAVAKISFSSAVTSRHGIAFGNGIVWVDNFCPSDGKRIFGGRDPCRPKRVLRIFTLNIPRK